MSIYTPTEDRLVPFTIPADGEDIDAASVNVAFGALGDGLERVSLRTEGARLIAPATRALWHTQAVVAPAFNAGAFWPATGGSTADYSNSAGTGRLILTKISASSTDTHGTKISISNDLIHGATLSSVAIRFSGSSMHTAGPTLPNQMPKVSVVRYTEDDVASSLLAAGVQADTSANGTIYGALHTITYTPDQNNVIDLETYSYALIFWTESGAAGIGGGTIYSIKLVHS